MHKKHDSHAFALICVLAITMFIGLCALSAFHQIRTSIVTIREELHTSVARSNATAMALETTGETRDVTRKVADCRDGEGTKGDVHMKKSLCAFLFPADSVKMRESILEGLEGFPGVDFNALFSKSTEVPCDQYPWSETTSSGFHLTPKAALSGSVCRLNSTINIKDVRITGNIAADSPLNASNPDSAAAYAILAATGFIDIASLIVSNGDLLIIGGGDVHVRTIRVSAPEYVRVTLISSTGVVQVEEIQGLANLKAIGREGVRIPPQYRAPSEHLLLPTLLEFFPLSLK